MLNKIVVNSDLQHTLAQCDAQLQSDPQNWQALAQRALAYYRLEQFDKALDDYAAALALEERSPALLNNFAVLLKDLGELNNAETLLLQALQLDKDFVDAWSNLGITRLHRRQYDLAAQSHIHSLHLAGETADRWINLGNALTLGHHLEDAIEAYQHALDLDPSNAIARYNLALPLFLTGRYLEAWAAYEARWLALYTPRFQENRWQGEPLKNNTLLLWCEQGLGDSLQMCRFIPMLQRAHPDAQLILACPDALQRLFAQTFSHIRCIKDDQSVVFDWQSPLCSLAGILQMTLDQLPSAPYFSTDAAWLQTLQETLPPAKHPLRVGFAWQSGHWGVGVHDLERQYKSIDSSLLMPLLSEVDAFSLQFNASLTPPLSSLLHASTLTDFASLAALIAQLDLVISVDTAVAHLAAAMGKPVWVLMRHEGALFYGLESKTPWYPSMRFFRQTSPGDWPSVIAQMHAALPAFVEEMVAH